MSAKIKPEPGDRERYMPERAHSSIRVVESCLGRFAFLSRELAEKVRRKSRAGRSGAHNVYRCDHCSAWHIGTAGPR